MGRLSLAEFRTEVATEIQRPNMLLTVEGIKRLDLWIHAAMYEFGYTLKLPELEGYAEQTLLAGTDDIALPDNFRYVHENGLVRLGVEGFEGVIRPETRAQYIKRHRTVGTSLDGPPSFYHRFAGNFKVRPLADKDYVVGVHFWQRVDLPAEETDLSQFTEDWDDVIILGAVYRGYRFYNEFDRYINVKNDFIGLIRSRRTVEDFEEFPEGGIHPVTDRDFDDSSTIYGIPEGDSDRFGEFR